MPRHGNEGHQSPANQLHLFNPRHPSSRPGQLHPGFTSLCGRLPVCSQQTGHPEQEGKTYLGTNAVQCSAAQLIWASIAAFFPAPTFKRVDSNSAAEHHSFFFSALCLL